MEREAIARTKARALARIEDLRAAVEPVSGVEGDGEIGAGRGVRGEEQRIERRRIEAK